MTDLSVDRLRVIGGKDLAQLPPQNRLRALFLHTALSIRAVQKKTVGRASRSIAGEITKRARATQPWPCDHFLRAS
jgi:hypothetical protein